LQTGAGAQPASYTVGIRSLPGLRRQDHRLTAHPHLALRLKKV